MFEPNGELIPIGGGDPIPLLRGTLTVGRRESCDIRLQYPNVSSKHCQLVFHDGYWYIKDLDSTNGVKINGVRHKQKLLHPGDEISIAKRRFKIQYVLQAGRKTLEEMEDEDVLGQSLLEKAGLEKPKRDQDDRFRNRSFDPGDFLLGDDE